MERPDFTVTFMLDAGDDLDRLQFNDIEVRLPDGSRWSATIATTAGIDEVMSEGQLGGEFLDRRFFWCRDLVIVRDSSLAAIVTLIEDILHSDEHELSDSFQRLDDKARFRLTNSLR